MAKKKVPAKVSKKSKARITKKAARKTAPAASAPGKRRRQSTRTSKKITHAEAERQYPGFRAVLEKNLAAGGPLGCCIVPNPAGGAPQRLPGIDQQTCEGPLLKGVWVPGNC